ncbi:MAG: ATP synthase F1 subunit gamma, partial [Clostridia bacterium]|nr:ATP synthase F1 subunit gamma [Clostridia bacterium]
MGANIKAIRARIKSVESTRHITKAMELVASSKIKRASAKMEQSRFYRSVMLDAFADLSAAKTMYSQARDASLPVLYIIVAGDRGLAGGYNNNIFRSSAVMLREHDVILPVGKRAVDYYSNKKYPVITKEFVSCEDMTADECSRAAYLIRDMYDRGEIGGVRLISTEFVSMLTQNPRMTHLLPLQKENGEAQAPAAVEYEPSAEAVLAALIPEYIAGVLYSSVCEAFASELAARRSAMDSATKNADEMLDHLSLKYNQARQSAITQEITEIV